MVGQKNEAGTLTEGGKGITGIDVNEVAQKTTDEPAWHDKLKDPEYSPDI
jgi:hypothetical protein